jgi:polysaccharide pyruvyl transferase CsaB
LAKVKGGVKLMKVAIAGYYGFDNAGDEAILSAIISSLRRGHNDKRHDLKLTVLSANPDKTAKNYGVQAIDRFNFSKIYKIFKEVDLFLIGGGSLLQDVTSRKSILYYLGLIYLAQKLKLPVLFYAQGVGPITGNLSRIMLPKVLNQVDRITVRDENSKELLLKLGVKKSIQVTADPVFGMVLPEDSELKEIIDRESLNLDKNTIGISVRYWQENNNYLSILAKVLDRINEELEVNILFLPLHYPIDLEASREVRKKMETEAQILEGEYHPRQIAGLFTKLSLLIGVRLHSLIFAAINRVPMIGISYDPKIDNFLARLDMQSVGKVEDLKETKLHNQIIKTWQNRDKIQNKLERKVRELEKLAEKNNEIVYHLLAKGRD